MSTTFSWASARSVKLRCDICGRTGYGGGTWMDACREGHPHQCPCGRRFTSTSGLSAHQKPRRSNSTPCPQQQPDAPESTASETT